MVYARMGPFKQATGSVQGLDRLCRFRSNFFYSFVGTCGSSITTRVLGIGVWGLGVWGSGFRIIIGILIIRRLKGGGLLIMGLHYVPKTCSFSGFDEQPC